LLVCLFLCICVFLSCGRMSYKFSLIGASVAMPSAWHMAFAPPYPTCHFCPDLLVKLKSENLVKSIVR
jgi:hypothetical protein